MDLNQHQFIIKPISTISILILVFLVVLGPIKLVWLVPLPPPEHNTRQVIVDHLDEAVTRLT